jgi:hypothetical protein
MSNRWFNVAIVVLWLASMTWLIAEKVAPPLRVGQRPTAAVDDFQPARTPVAWQLLLNDRPLGWASTDTLARPDGVLELHNRVHLDRLPLRETAPWLARLLDPQGRDERTPFDTDSRVELSDGQLLGFRTSVSFGGIKDAILVNGTVEDNELKLNVRAGELDYSTTSELSNDTLVSDSLSPRARLSGLRVGQTWTEPVYNPLRPPNSPLEILHAMVDRLELTAWQGEMVKAAVVVYRDDPGSDSKAARVTRARAWVAPNGDVLKQEVTWLGVKLLFVRLPPGQNVEGIPPL